MPGCVPVFDAYPLPEVPPEILNLTKQLGMAVEGFQMSQGIKAWLCFFNKHSIQYTLTNVLTAST